MADVKARHELYAFNRGVISPLALARLDIARVALSAETQTNWVPRVLGSMSLRPGLEYLGNSASNAKARYLPFIFSATDTALIELTDVLMRVRVDEALVTRAAVSTAVTNGNFTSDVTSWTDSDEGTAASAWLTGGYLSLLGTDTSSAIREQTLTVAAGDQNVEHALRIVVTQGVLTLKVGSSSGGDEYITETSLAVGTHSLAFTPTGASVYLRLSNREDYPTLVDSINIEGSGVMTLATPWVAANLGLIRFDQSGDIIFTACTGIKQKQIERRATRSWSIVDYVAPVGPFRNYNTSTVTLTPSALNGTITLTASKALFKSTNVGGLYAINSTGQAVSESLGTDNVFSDPIRVTGVGAGRMFGITITGTWVATITLQQATDEAGPWTDITSYTTNQSTTYNDTLDNQILYYRIGIKTAGYTSGTATAQLAYTAGTIKGIAKVTVYTSPTVVTAVVLKDFGALTASSDWAEGFWSDRRGYPSAVGFADGRLWFAGKDKILGSVSDDYVNFDEDTVGDSGPIIRSIGSGPVDSINWLVVARNMVMGAQMAEFIIRSSALGEPVTPTNFNMPKATTYGSAAVSPVQVDRSVVFTDRSLSRVMEAVYDTSTTEFDTIELTSAAPDFCLPAIVAMAVQRRPDTRIHCVLSDGTVAMLVFDKNEEVKCWVKITTDGVVEDAVVLPGTREDAVYYSVKRTINGSTVRFLEKWAQENECVGGTVNKQADAFYYWTGAASANITGLSHLEGETVVCWANGVYQGTFTVASSQINIPEAVTSAVVGLVYQAVFTSTKLAKQLKSGGTTIGYSQRISHLGLVLANTHAKGLQYGSDMSNLYDLPDIEDGTLVDADSIWEAYDKEMVEFDGAINSDIRLWLVANAPKPCTVLAALIDLG